MIYPSIEWLDKSREAKRLAFRAATQRTKTRCVMIEHRRKRARLISFSKSIDNNTLSQLIYTSINKIPLKFVAVSPSWNDWNSSQKTDSFRHREISSNIELNGKDALNIPNTYYASVVGIIWINTKLFSKCLYSMQQKCVISNWTWIHFKIVYQEQLIKMLY